MSAKQKLVGRSKCGAINPEGGKVQFALQEAFRAMEGEDERYMDVLEASSVK